MSVVAAAVVPAAPLLVPDLAGGSLAVDEDLRAAVRAAVDWLLDGGPEPLLVLAAAPATGETSGVWDLSGFGVRRRGGPGPGLPPLLTVGAWFVDDALRRKGTDPSARVVRYFGVASTETAQRCAELGAELGASFADGSQTRLLVVADGSACRTEKAPGFFHPQAEDFDAVLTQALATGDVATLQALDRGLAADLRVHGAAALQVLAGAVAAAGRLEARLDVACSPYGVLYLVARWDCAPSGVAR